MASLTPPALPSSPILILTRYTGYIASHIVDSLLAQGYQVRGTARAASKLDGLKALWAKKYPKATFEVAVVEDLTKDGAFEEAVKGLFLFVLNTRLISISQCPGVSGVIHAASVVSFSLGPEEVIDPVVNGTLSILRAAATQSSITRFVLTSSSIAGDYTRPNEVYPLDENSWNDVSVEQAHKKGEGFEQGAHVYAASKILGEKAAWKFVQDEKPGFVLNTILPNYTLGPILDPASQSGSSGSTLKPAVEKEDFGFLTILPRQ